MIDAINYLGKQKILHLDFKPENICLNVSFYLCSFHVSK